MPDGPASRLGGCATAGHQPSARLRSAPASEGWWRGRDSNPRGPCEPTSFQDWRFQPLSHPSAKEESRITDHESRITGRTIEEAKTTGGRGGVIGGSARSLDYPRAEEGSRPP